MSNNDKIKYDNEYIKQNYDAIRFTVPKGDKEKIKQKAETKGYKSMSDYIKTLIRNDMGGGI